jgi:hypothetical protein
LAFEICCIMFHSFCFSSGESGCKCMRVIKYLYTAIMCSAGWFKKKIDYLLSVLVGLEYKPTSILDSIPMSNRSKKFICPFFSCVGLNMILPCT